MLRRFWLVTVCALWPGYAVAQNGGAGHMNGNNAMDGYGSMHGYGRMMDFWGGHIVTWILLLIGAGVLVYVVARAGHAHHSDTLPHEPPIETLKRRYARGDITKEQFEEMKKDL